MDRFTNNLFVLLFTVGLTVLFPTVASAITFAPERIDTEVYPGVSRDEKLTLLNETGEPLSVLLEPVELDLSQAEFGSASFRLDTRGGATVSWLSVFPEQFVLDPGEQREVRVRITAPNGSSGSQLAGIAVTSRPVRSDDSGSIAITAITGPHVFARVLSDGSVVDGSIVSFEAAGASSFFSGLPVSLNVSFANSGTVHVKPTGSIVVRDVFGRRVDQLIVNAEGRIVLPQTTRVLPLHWGRTGKESSRVIHRVFDRPLFGPFHLEATIDYGGDSAVSARTTLWFVPWRLFLVLGVILVGIAVVRRRLRRVSV